MSRPQIQHESIPLPPAEATSNRVKRCTELRKHLAAADADRPEPLPVINGDEQRYADKSGTYSKGVKQDSVGLVNPTAFQTFRDALNSGSPHDFHKLIEGGPKTQNGPQGGLAFSLDCLDNSQYLVKPAAPVASELYAAELIELYWASLLRDVAYTGYASNPLALKAAEELSSLPVYEGPRVAGRVTPDVLFRGKLEGETTGPYVSQFLLLPTSLGALPLTQKYNTLAANQDFMMDPVSFQQVQNGQPTGFSLTNEPPVYLHNGRGFAAYTHVDVLYQAYFTAYLYLSGVNGTNPPPFNPGNPYIGSKTQNGFGTFGNPDIASSLAAVAAEALKAVWYQKWFVHLRHRPESGGALVHLANTPSAPQAEAKLSDTVLNSRAVSTSREMTGSYFLSQAFPEGSPIHPAYPTGHGTVAGACITVLKFFFDGDFTIPFPKVPASDGSELNDYSGGRLTVNGELHKLARNISFGHGVHAGIHWRSDTDTSIQLGEAVALSYLEEKARTYNEKFKVKFKKLDGTHVTISN